MAFVITQPCIDTTDQACVDVCPVDCIHFEQGADRMLYIDPTECIDCGACQPACPVSAIFPESDVPADQRPFVELNSLWYQDPAAARARVGEFAGGAAAPAPAAAAAPASEPSTEVPSAGASEAPPPPTPAAAEAPPPAPARKRPAPVGTYKYGESGVEGKCARCGTYVIKGGVKFRRKSVLCPDCAAHLEHIGNPYQASLGSR